MASLLVDQPTVSTDIKDSTNKTAKDYSDFKNAKYEIWGGRVEGGREGKRERERGGRMIGYEKVIHTTLM